MQYLDLMKEMTFSDQINGSKVAWIIMQSNATQSIEMNKYITGQE